MLTHTGSNPLIKQIWILAKKKYCIVALHTYMQYLWKMYISPCLTNISYTTYKRLVVWSYQCLNIYHAWYLERGVITNFIWYIFLALKSLVFRRINSKNNLLFQVNHMVYLEIFLLITRHTLVGRFVLIVCQYRNVLEQFSLYGYQLFIRSIYTEMVEWH